MSIGIYMLFIQKYARSLPILPLSTDTKDKTPTYMPMYSPKF